MTKSEEEYSGLQELISIEKCLKNYNSDIAHKIQSGWKYANFNQPETLLDFGAGIGTLADIFRRKFKVFPVCLELDTTSTDILIKKGFSTISSLDEIQDHSQSVIYTSNVLEHIEDDNETLRVLNNKMKKGGVLTIYVPALPILYSEFDRVIGHYRRYQKRELVSKVTKAGFTVKECYWNDSIGILTSLALKISGYKSTNKSRRENSLVFYDRFVYPISKILDFVIFRKLIGKNLFLHATKP